MSVETAARLKVLANINSFSFNSAPANVMIVFIWIFRIRDNSTHVLEMLFKEVGVSVLSVKPLYSTYRAVSFIHHGLTPIDEAW